MTSVGLVREKTFEDIIKSKGVTVEAPFRPFTELQHDPHVMAFNLRASLDEIREMELRAQLHRRRMEDIREAAARQGIPLGAYMAQMPPIPRQNSAHMAVDPEYNQKVELSEEEREARIRELHESLARNRAQAAADVESAANANPTLTEQVADAAGVIGGRPVLRSVPNKGRPWAPPTSAAELGGCSGLRSRRGRYMGYQRLPKEP